MKKINKLMYAFLIISISFTYSCQSSGSDSKPNNNAPPLILSK